MSKFVVKDFDYRGHHFDKFSIDIIAKDDGSKKSATELHDEWLKALNSTIDKMESNETT